MPIKDGELIQHAGFPLGLVNTTKETEIPRADNGAALGVREADNLNFSATGKPSLREGYSLVIALGQGHSGWSDDYLDFGLLVDTDTLYAVDEDGSMDALATGLAPTPVSYCRIHDTVYWCNGTQAAQVTRDRTARPWAAPRPPGLPTVAPSADGSLDAGEWQVTVTVLDQWGRESGAPRAVPVTLASVGGIALSNIPQPPAGGQVRIYAGATAAELRAAVTVDAGVDTLTLVARPRGRPLETLLLQHMPPGHLVAHGNGRQYVARGKELLFSPPLRYGLFDAKKGRVGFVDRLDMIAFVGDGTDGAGLFVADRKRTYFLAGPDPMNWRYSPVSVHGAVPGQIAMVPGEVFPELNTQLALPVWLASNGRLCVGLAGGVIYHPKPREGDPVAVFDAADSAALMFRETAGDRRVIAALRGRGTQAFAVKDQLVVREIRHDEDNPT